MATDNTAILQWATALCEQAKTAKEAGDTSLFSRIGANSALNAFYANAIAIKSVPMEKFSQYFPSQWMEITHLHEAYVQEVKINESLNKVDELSNKFDKLQEQLTAFIESQKPADEKPAAKKTGKKPAAAAADVTDDETPADESAESEA